MFFDIPMNNNHLDLYNGGWFRLPNKYSSYYYFDVYLEDDVVKIDFDNVINNKDFIDIISEYDSPTYYYGNQQKLFPISNSKFNGLNIKWSTPSMVNPINVSFYSSRNKNRELIGSFIIGGSKTFGWRNIVSRLIPESNLSGVYDKLYYLY